MCAVPPDTKQDKKQATAPAFPATASAVEAPPKAFLPPDCHARPLGNERSSVSTYRRVFPMYTILRTDGTEETIDERPTLHGIREAIHCDTLDVVQIGRANGTDEIML